MPDRGTRIALLVLAGLVRPTLRNSMQPTATDLPASLAAAHELEADPPQRVASHPSVVDAESDTLYGDPVPHGDLVKDFTATYVELPDTSLRIIVAIDGQRFPFSPRQAEELSTFLHRETQLAVEQIRDEL